MMDLQNHEVAPSKSVRVGDYSPGAQSCSVPALLPSAAAHQCQQAAPDCRRGLTVEGAYGQESRWLHNYHMGEQGVLRESVDHGGQRKG